MKSAMPKTGLVCVILLCLFTPFSACADQDGPARQSDALREKIEILRARGELTLHGAAIAACKAIPELYEQCRFKLLWWNPEAVAAMLESVAAIETDGLSPRDYHFEQLTALAAKLEKTRDARPALAADLDLLLSDSLIRLAYHLYYGKVDPRLFTPAWSFAKPLPADDSLRVIEQSITENRLRELLESLKPQIPYYRHLKAALAQYRQILKTGGWKSIPDGPELRKGIRNSRVRLLRQRLASTGEPIAASQDVNLFDDHLEDALRGFQYRHGLSVTGRVNRSTLLELNTPVASFIQQIQANLEQARWVMHDIPRRFVIVDIAGYLAHTVQEGEILNTHRVQVGHPFRKTPVFRSRISYVVFNPTWTVPPGVLKDSVLPKIRKDISYLEKAGLDLVDLDGRKLDPAGIDWTKVNPSKFPHRLRKAPGPGNPMGRVKIMFPNPYLVYLHDTDAKEKFEDEWRANSSGCIRVEHPLELVRWLLGDSTRWSSQNIQATVGKNRSRTVFLDEPVPILVMYQTVGVDKDGQVIFREDVYKRDKAIVQGLDQPFRFHAPAM